MYRRVESCVLVDGKTASFFEIEVGVRQGCMISPMLFLLFINGLAEEIKRRGRGVLHGNVKNNILLFADDIVLLAENRQGLEFLMQVTYESRKKWRFNFNYDKSAGVIFESKSKETIVYGECKSVTMEGIGK